MPTDKVSLELDSSGFERVLSSMRNFADQQIGLGSSAGDTGFLRVLGSAMGFNPASLARGAYQSSLSGMGLIGNLRAGNPIQYDTLQPVDYGKRLINLIEELVRIEEKQGHDAARLFARQTDIEEALKITLLSPAHQQEYLRMLRRQTDAGGPFAKAQAEFDFAKAKFLDQVQQKGAPIGTLGFNALAQLVRNLFNFGTPELPQGTTRVSKGGASGSLNANTQAVNDLADELRRTREGIFGGGRRARSAMPGAFGIGWGGFLPDALRSQTVRLGAYSISM
jgi:hypothetical protein